MNTPAAKELPCEECGGFDAREIAGRQLCDDCIALAGCGCAGDKPEPDGE